MEALVAVKNIDGLIKSAEEIQSIRKAANLSAQNLIQQLHILVEQAEAELSVSRVMLEESVVRENLARVELLSAEVELAAASAELAEAVAIGNSVAILMAEERFAEAQRRYSQAQQEYEEAVQHREQMVKRVELNEEALSRAQNIFDTTQAESDAQLRQIEDVSECGVSVLKDAHETMERYIAITTVLQRQEFAKWDKPEKQEISNDKPVMPDELRERLNPSKEVMLGLLAATMAKDDGVRNSIEEYHKLIAQGESDKVDLRVRRNLSGRLSEEIVKHAFALYGEIDGQVHREVEDYFTKVDVVVRNLKKRVILGRRLYADKDGTIGIEVKTGKKEYLLQQKDHIILQAQGHSCFDVSCVLVSRDIHELSYESENVLRSEIKGAGSRIWAVLPEKEKIDNVCLEFVFGRERENDSNV